MKFKGYIKSLFVFSVSFLMLACEDFLEVDAPDNQLIREQVFDNEATAKSAMTGIYNQLFQVSFSNGSRNSVSVLAGLSADNLENIYTGNLSRMEFQLNEISPDNEDNLDLWSGSFNMIYMTNSFLEGLLNSSNISAELKNQLEGEARFVRAFTYFYLVNLYGDVPLILTTNYRDNELAGRTSASQIYEQIIDDLSLAEGLLSSEYREGERTRVNSYAAKALLARVYLYLEDWEMAASLSTEVIDATSNYELLNDLNEVFLANSKEAIWQISPIGAGGIVTMTNEGALFIIDPFFNFFASLKLNGDLIGEFQETDKRLQNWIDYNSDLDAYFPTKYKIDYSTSFPIEEYSMVLRLAEQYLIRAEAEAHQGKFEGAIQDINVLRARAGADIIPEADPGMTQDSLLDLVILERRKEFFTEWGLRWLDLKRTGRAGNVLGSDNSPWEDTDVLYPIPEEEIKKNPNLSQNAGY